MNGGVRGVVRACGGVFGVELQVTQDMEGWVKQTRTEDRDAGRRRATRPTTPLPLAAHVGTISFGFSSTRGVRWVARGGGCG